MKYLVQYKLPYEHIVMVGIQADSREAAIAKAIIRFDEGDIWDDTTELPLLYDDHEEIGGTNLRFTVEQEMPDEAEWPEPDSSVLMLRRQRAAFTAARLLIEAYQAGEKNGGSIDCNDLDQAYEAALRAMAMKAL